MKTGPEHPRRARARYVVGLLALVAGALAWLTLGAGDHEASDARVEVAAAVPAPEPRADAAPDDEVTRATVWVEVVSVEGDPVVGAAVTLETVAGEREQRSDESGLVTFEGLWPGPYDVLITAAGYEPLPAREQLRPGLAEAAWTFRLTPSADAADAVRGVVRSDGAPVAGALVAWLADDTALPEGATLTGADGRFTLPRAKDATALVAFHERHGLTERTLAGDNEVLLELPAPGFVEGRVTDHRGRPLPEHQVQALVSGLPRGLVRALASASGGGRRAAAAAHRRLSTSWERFPLDTVAEAGAFRVGPLAAGLVRVVASAPGRAPAEVEVRVRAGGVTSGVVLQLAGPVVVTGCVRDAKTGDAVRGARVQTVRAPGPSAPGFGSAVTGDDGCYRLLTTADVRHSVGVRARGYVFETQGGVVGRADEEVRKDFTLTRAASGRDGFRYVGIGAQLKGHDDGAVVVGVFDSGSAHGALSAGDVILRVDGVWTEGLPLPRIVEMIVGEDGTEVELLVQPQRGPVETVILSRQRMSSRG